MEFRILGPMEIEAGGELLALGGAQQRAVLALLLVRAPEALSPDRLIDEVWGERPPATAAHAVQVYVSEIRKLLRAGSGAVAARTSPSGYLLDIDPDRVDARRFEQLTDEAQRLLADDPSRARGLFGEALELWRGEPLTGLQQFQFARLEADRLDELRAVAVEGLVEARLACGEHAEVTGAITGLVTASPLRERPRRLLMLALYRSGRHAEALAAYRDGCEALDEIGLQPGPELRQLQGAILRHDPSLRSPNVATEVEGDPGAIADRGQVPKFRSRELPRAGTVTMLFTDIEGSTQLADRLGDRYPELLAEHDRVMRDAIEATGGYEVSTAGDSFFVVFVDAADALECACRAQRELGAGVWADGHAPRVRMGIHAGAPDLRGDTYVGIEVNRAARVMAVASGGQVLLTDPARGAAGSLAEVRDLGYHRLKDLATPERLFQLVAPGLATEFPRLRSLQRSNLPTPPDPLVGRRAELERALELLSRADIRLLTLLGPGGAGKTRLAIELAGEAVGRYRDGTWFVALAPLTDPALVASEIARTVGIREAEGKPLEDTLTEALARQELLLVLDNFEHLPGAAGLVSRLLASASRLTVLATSRAALHISGEHRMDVPPLPLADAAQLFLGWARAVRADLQEDEHDREAVERICLRLDGLPPALELAAARIALFSLPALEARLADRLDLPEGPPDLPDRQRTLRATVDWSYQLLSPDEQTLFRGLRPFAGGARLDTIESVFRDLDAATIEVVAALVDKSLLRRREDADGEPRFWMLDTIREYASDALQRDGDAEAVMATHAAYFLDLALRGEPHMHTRSQPTWITRWDADHDNLRAAFDHLVARAPPEAARMAAALGFFWEIHGHITEGRERLRHVLASYPGEGPAVAKAYFHAGRIAFSALGNGDEAEPLLADAVRLARKARDSRVEALALGHLGMVAQSRHQTNQAVELLERAHTIARAGTDEWAFAAASNNLGEQLVVMGELERARALLGEALETRRLADRRALSIVASNLAELALADGDLDSAGPLIAEAVKNSREIGYESQAACGLALQAMLDMHRGELESAARQISEGVESIRADYDIESSAQLLAAAAALAAIRGDPLRAAQLWAASDRELRRLGDEDSRAARPLRDEWLPNARGEVDAATWEMAWDAGQNLTPDQAFELAARTRGSLPAYRQQ